MSRLNKTCLWTTFKQLSASLLNWTIDYRMRRGLQIEPNFITQKHTKYNYELLQIFDLKILNNANKIHYFKPSSDSLSLRVLFSKLGVGGCRNRVTLGKYVNFR